MPSPLAFDACSPRRLLLPDGAEIAYRVVGPPEEAGASCTVLAFNGAYLNMALWRHAADAWAAAGVRVLLHDCRGVGASRAAAHDAAVDQFTFDRYCADAAALLEHVGAAKVVVAGMAWGARPALVFAARHPQLTAACLLYDLSVGNSSTPEHADAQKKSLMLARDEVERLGIKEPPSNDKSSFEHADRGMAGRAMAATSKPPYNRHDTFLEIVAGGVLCPTLIAIGEFDPNLVVKDGGARAVVATLERRLPAQQACELTILHATGHASLRTSPLQCAAVALDFLRRARIVSRPSAL